MWCSLHETKMEYLCWKKKENNKNGIYRKEVLEILDTQPFYNSFFYIGKDDYNRTRDILEWDSW